MMIKVHAITAANWNYNSIILSSFLVMTILCIFVPRWRQKGKPSRRVTKGTERLRWIKNEESELPVGTYSRRRILY